MKINIVVFCFCLITSVVQAQVYFRANVGYALPAAQETIGSNDNEVLDNNSYTATSEPVKAAYGAGVNFGLGGGYMFTKIIGVDLGITYLSGKTFETHYDFTEIGFGSEKLDSEMKSKAIYIAPSILITPGDKLPYVRMGVVMAVPKIEGKDTYFYNGDGEFLASSEWEQRKNMAFGFQGAIGMQWALSSSMKLFTEMTFTSMTYYPGEKVATSYFVDGENVLNEVDEYYKKTIYKDKVVYSPPTNYDAPSEEVQVSIPFSSLSFQIGVVYTLGGKIQE